MEERRTSMQGVGYSATRKKLAEVSWLSPRWDSASRR